MRKFFLTSLKDKMFNMESLLYHTVNTPGKSSTWFVSWWPPFEYALIVFLDFLMFNIFGLLKIDIVNPVSSKMSES